MSRAVAPGVLLRVAHHTLGEIWTLKGSLFRALINRRRLFNALKNVSSTRLNSTRALADPLLLFIEPSSRCNTNCLLCPTSGLKDQPRGEMDFSLYSSVIDEIGDSLFFVCLWFYGEPTLNEDLARMVTHARDKGILTSITTNGIALDRGRVDALLDAHLDYLFVSLDGATPEVYDKYRGEGNFARVKANLEYLARAKRERGIDYPLVELKPIINVDTEQQMGELLVLAGDLRADRLTYQVMTYSHSSEMERYLPREKAFVLDYPEGPADSPCHRILSSSVVCWDGSVVPCCEDYSRTMVMGNVKEQGFRAVWRGDAYRELRESLLQGGRQDGVCATCHIREFDIVNYSLNLIK